METGLASKSTLVHSPGSHYHSQTTNKNDVGSSTSENESEVSDMVIENSSRFEGLSKKRRKSGGSDYHPLSASDSMSESESESVYSRSGSDRSTPFSQKQNSSNTRPSDDESEMTSSRSVSMTPVRGSQFKHSPLVRKSPLSVTHRSAPSEVTAMRGYRYSMLPSRSAAANVSYSRYLEDESDSDYPGFGSRKRKRLAKDSSESEFEVGAKSEESASDISISDEDFSESEHQPLKRKARGRQQRDWGGSETDSDYQPGSGRRRGKGRKKVGRKNDGYMHDFVSDGGSSVSSSESEFEPGCVNKKRKKSKRKKEANRGFESPSDYVRTTGRSKGVVSYKDFYGSGTDGSGEGEGDQEGEEVLEGEGTIPAVEDNRETLEKILKKRTGRVGDTGNKTTCYAKCLEAGSDPVVLSGIAQGNKEFIAKLEFTFNTPPPAPDEPSEVQYLVKWLNWSHLHNTWETEASLASKDIKGMKKFHNFLKREEEREQWEAGATLEDIEYMKCQEELSDQLLVGFTQVERVVADKTNAEGEKEYLCKWRGLPYSECTWEDAHLLSSWFQGEIDEYIERNTSDRIPNKNAKVLRHRPKFAYMKEQLRSLGGPGKFQLRDYQLEGVNWLVKSWCKNNSVILADEMGLGKTIQCISFLHTLFHMHQLYGPYLIVVPLSTLPAWQREFELWAPEMNTVVYIGDVSSRNKIREFEWSHPNRKLKFNTLLTTYEILLKDKEFLGSVAWTALMVDEAHRLKNDDSLLYRTLMEFRTNYRLLITGTPLQNSLKELWSLLHFIMEKKFPNWEDFEYDNKAYGEGDASSLTSIHQELQPFLLRRMKKDVEKSLPAKVEQILRVEMSSVQKQYYRWILTKNYKALSKGVKGSITGFINIMMELKKCCNHVWIVRSPDEKEEREKDKLQTLIRGSGKLYLLDKLLVRLSQTGHRVLIFSQMVRMLDVLAEYMRLRHFHFQRLDGSIRGDSRKDAIDHFNAEGSNDFCFLLSTRAGGLGVNLATADTVVIFDSDWNPQNDLQAQARAHRIGQKKQVNIYRLVTKNSVEEDIIERAKKKMVLDHLVIQRMDTTGHTILSTSKEPSRSVPFDKDELNAILKFGADELFKSSDGAAGGSEDKALQELDIDDILSRAEMQATADESSHSDLLSQFKVASFAMDEEELAPPPSATPTDSKSFLLSPRGRGQRPVERSWEELIPEEARRKVDEEEKTREQLDLYLPPRQRKVRNYCEDQPQGKSKTRSGAPSTKDSAAGCSTVVAKNVRGFTDSEIRRFIKSYRKFVNPKTRLGDIAADAELQEKSMSELQRLMTVLHEGCVQAEEEHRASIEIDPKYDPKKDKGASLRLCGVTVGSGNLLRREEELAALACVIPANPAVRKKYRMASRPKSVNWSGVKWTAVDDARLLIGIYEHGLGNWESIRDDPNLNLTDKILKAEPSLKPQASHLQTRAEYLFKLLQVEAEKMRRKTSKKSSHSAKKPSAHASAAKNLAKKPKNSRSHGNSTHLTVHVSRDLLESESASTKKRRAGKHANKKRRFDETSVQARSSPRRKEKVFIPGERTSPRKRKARGEGGKGAEPSKPMEDGAEDPSDAGGGELDDDTFKKCKSLLKPVKAAMMELQEPTDDSDHAAMVQFKKALVEVGDHITTTLAKEDRKLNLWAFVSKFTTSDAQQLLKMYKKAKKAGDTSSNSGARKDGGSHGHSSMPHPPRSSHEHKVPSSSGTVEAAPNHSAEAPPHHSTGVPDPASGQRIYAQPADELGREERSRHSSGGDQTHSRERDRVRHPSGGDRPHTHERDRVRHSSGGDHNRSHERDRVCHPSGGDHSHYERDRAHHSPPRSHAFGQDRIHYPSSGTRADFKERDREERSRHLSGDRSRPSEHDRGERRRHPSGSTSDHSYSSEVGHRYEEVRHSHYHHGDRHRHSSGSSYHSDGGSGNKRPRYHSPHHHSRSSSLHRQNSHSHN